jgi:hypothetical protein
MNRVPRLTPTAPSISAAAMPRSSKMPDFQQAAFTMLDL